MSHITSSWALSYGLTDPAGIAAEITAADAGIADSAARLLNSIVLALRFGREKVRSALAAVESGWSTVASHDALRTLISLVDQVEQAGQDTRSACTALSSAIAKAHADVATAYAAADRAIAAMDLASWSWTGGIDEMLRVEAERCTLVWNLTAALSAAARTLDASAEQASAAMTTDPTAALPSAASPAAGQHLANMALLRDDLRAPAGRRHHFALAVNGALQQARAAGYPAQLLSYDPDDPVGQGGVAVAIGDVSRASSVAVLVPGVGNSPTDIAGSIELAHALDTAADAAGGPDSHTATVLWFGYDIPLSVAKDGLWADSPAAAVHTVIGDTVRAIDASGAVAGGVGLAAFVRTLRPLTGPASNLTLIGHSYGSTTVAQAARVLDRNDGVDDIVLLGSPGVGYRIDTAEDFSAVSADHVYSLSFPFDPVPAVGASAAVAAINPMGGIARRIAFGPDTGPFGPDPTGAEFGGTVISADSNVPVDAVVDFDQHALSNYLSGSSLAAVGAVTAARYQQVPVRPRP